ncbi:hypothetical protein GQ43DRAFT_369628 [Delitschia confertaspora ATCC 74209]|uniref:Glycoside hydrolase family 125 protein n=1 Tax=Delitschia confertaspora ATCC 74209 TaxID=1513339 RepID=A0A9P4JN99_9PLEO|nr:hypothetical protein GQ43DRAFT_369628 [Delitschia confertaspora ATCC 74209]
MLPHLIAAAAVWTLASAQCPLYANYANEKHAPYSGGRYNLSYQRPIPSCRTFHSPEVEETITRLKDIIVDPDLFRLFENAYPNTLDTTIAWRGYANGENGTTTDEELAFVVTGDIEAMWLRDSANQLQAYTSLLQANTSRDSLASLFRGVINLQGRYIQEAPFCNAFQAPSEAGRKAHSSMNSDTITPSFDYMKVFSCNWELDSLASFLSLSNDYITATNDITFFQKYQWVKTVETILQTAESMRMDSYKEDGHWQHTPYTYCAPYGGTPINDCNGSPHKGNIGLIRSFHRPSDDACTYQYLIPSNMMFSATLNSSASLIMAKLDPSITGNLTVWMKNMATEVHQGIEEYGVIHDRTYGEIYAYEVDGYGGTNIMDDANVPSLLSAPFLGYLNASDTVYQNTRKKILSKDNPYYAWGPVISGVGSPHTRPGRPWPMALIMEILTGREENEGGVVRALRDLVGSTGDLGLMHESVSSHYEHVWSRQWFSWANGLFGQAILDLEKRMPHILKMGFQ